MVDSRHHGWSSACWSISSEPWPAPEISLGITAVQETSVGPTEALPLARDKELSTYLSRGPPYDRTSSGSSPPFVRMKLNVIEL